MATALGSAHPNPQRLLEPQAQAPTAAPDSHKKAGQAQSPPAAHPATTSRQASAQPTGKTKPGPAAQAVPALSATEDTSERAHPAASSWKPTLWSLGLALPTAGIGIARMLPQLGRPLPGLPGPIRDNSERAEAADRRRAGSVVRRTPFERFFGDIEARMMGPQPLGVNPLALPQWRLPHIAATLTLPLPSPGGTGGTTLRVRLQRPQLAPGPAAVAVVVTRAKSNEVTDLPAGDAGGPQPARSAAPSAVFASGQTQAAAGAVNASPAGLSVAATAAGTVRAGGGPPAFWAGLEPPRGAKLQPRPQLNKDAEAARAQAKARSKSRFKAFERAGAYSARVNELDALDETLATQPSTPRRGSSQ